MKQLGIIDKTRTAFVFIDIQDKLISVAAESDKMIKNINTLFKASEILEIPAVVTEQCPEKLGETTIKVEPGAQKHLVEKKTFSCFGNKEFVAKIKKLKVDSIVISGTEAHICVLQTALDALQNKLDVYVVADATSSRTLENKNIAIERMRQSGVFMVSTEMILFQLLQSSEVPEFKLISQLVK